MPVSEDLLASYGQLKLDAERRKFVAAHPEIRCREVVDALCKDLRRWLRIDLERAQQVASAARWLADRLADPTSIAKTLRAEAHVQQLRSRFRQAQVLYERAATEFAAVGNELEVAITHSGSLGNLMYLGRYELAQEWFSAAARVFEKLDDSLRQARLQSNYATLLGRQDRWAEALERYRTSFRQFLGEGQAQDAAVTLRNISVCHIMCDEFREALGAYEEARDLCRKHGFIRLELENEYNISYMYYLRGEYMRALQLYQVTRRRCEEHGDGYHKALCDLDQAEIYIELNLIEEAVELATRAYATFEALGTPYERARSLTNLAIAVSRQGDLTQAEKLFREARAIFQQEKNQLWRAMIDLYRGVILLQKGRLAECRRLALRSRRFFADSALTNRMVLCDLLLAEVSLSRGKTEAARQECHDALEALGGCRVPALQYRAYLILARIHESCDDVPAAIAAYRRSQDHLERLCTHLGSEQLKISFLEDKLEVYQGLVSLCLRDRRARHPQGEDLFAVIEKAKSRSLTDLLLLRARPVPPKSPYQTPAVDRVGQLRHELNWHYRQIDQAELKGNRPRREIERLRQKARQQEDELLLGLRELAITDYEFGSLQTAEVIDVASVRSSLPAAAVLLEYFIARDTIYVGVLGRGDLNFRPIASVARVADLQRLLRLQLSKLRLRHPTVTRSLAVNHKATQAYLQKLYQELVAPIRQELEGSTHLVVVPHGPLHYIPFHALRQGGEYLIDRFSISFCPSASVFHLSRVKRSQVGSRALVLGIADDRAPHTLDEARAVARSLPGAKLLLGEEATEDALRSSASDSRFVHIATHGIFRRDNPMFSAIQLGTSRLSLFDLYHLSLDAEMMVLSGCSTGLSEVVGADELIGLSRGALYAGAKSVLVTLWDVNDASTAEFMAGFYRNLGREPSRAEALRVTMLEARERWPHPFFWAPFVLVGDPGIE